jgi:hypothetical protein
MSAAATAAGYLYASGRLRGSHGKEVGAEQRERQRKEAEDAAVALRRDREAKEKEQRRKGR